jgi:hypothetical protein
LALAKDHIYEDEYETFQKKSKKLLQKILVKKQKLIRFSKDEDKLEAADSKLIKAALHALLKKVTALIQTNCKDSEGNPKQACLLMVFDNVQTFDLESLKILTAMQNGLDGIVTIFTYRTTHQQRFSVMKYLDDLESLLKSSGTTYERISLQPLAKEDLTQLMYQFVQLKFDQDLEIEEKIIEYVLECVNGNPNDCIQMMNSLIGEEYCFIKEGKVYTTSKFREFLKYKVINKLATLPPSMHNKFHSVFNGLGPSYMLVLYLAATWGDTFDDYILSKIDVFEHLDETSIKKILVDLDNFEIIETINVTKTMNVYRFCDPAVKKMCYDRMLFSQRSLLSKIYNQILRVNPLPDYLVPEGPNKEENIRHLMFYHFDSEYLGTDLNMTKRKDQMMNEIKQSLTVQQVVSALQESRCTTNRVCSGKVQKFDTKTRQLSERFAVLTQEAFFYYNNEESYENSTENFIVKIELGDITLVNQFVNKTKNLDGETVESYELDIYSNLCYKIKKILGPRVFKFTVPSYGNFFFKDNR